MSVARAESSGMIAARINRLPITRVHTKLIILLSLIFLFELGDLNTFGLSLRR